MLTGNTEPFPELLQGVIDHLVEWELLPAHKKPNGCIINFFDEVLFSLPVNVSIMMDDELDPQQSVA